VQRPGLDQDQHRIVPAGRATPGAGLYDIGHNNPPLVKGGLFLSPPCEVGARGGGLGKTSHKRAVREAGLGKTSHSDGGQGSGLGKISHCLRYAAASAAATRRPKWLPSPPLVPRFSMRVVVACSAPRGRPCVSGCALFTPPNPPFARGGKMPASDPFPPLVKGGQGGVVPAKPATAMAGQGGWSRQNQSLRWQWWPRQHAA
jgi:hypothetical protein